MKNFGTLIYSNMVSVNEMAEWCHISRQLIYKYIRGEVNPNKISYVNIVHMASFLDLSETEVYNSICVSFESVHEFNEDSGKWE